jgi:hypothetical protein
MNLCPEEIVEEHRRSLLKGTSPKWQEQHEEPEIVDAEARDITGEQHK